MALAIGLFSIAAIVVGWMPGISGPAQNARGLTVPLLLGPIVPRAIASRR